MTRSSHTVQITRRMALLAAMVAASSCGPSRGEPERPHRGAGGELVAREFIEGDWGAIRHRVWIEPGRESGIDTDDPCCGLWYDGNQYADQLAACATPADDGDEACASDQWEVSPGIADDRVCGERTRCVPLPAARLVVLDYSKASATDGDERLLPTGSDPSAVAHAPVQVTREGAFVAVKMSAGVERSELVAVDFGSRYTITVRAGRVVRVTRD